MSSKQYKRYTITAALPYANGPVHIGHLAGVYIPADIYARYLRMKDEDVLFVCGSDEHGVAITLKARQQNTSPKEIVDRYHEQIKTSFEEFGVSFDIYSRTSSQTHHKTASDFFLKLYEKGVFEEKTNEQFFDPEAEQFLADRYIYGTCPNCSFEKAYGDQCENCGTSLSPHELINPKSALSGSEPVLKTTRHWYLPLNDYENWLRTWILEEHKEWKPNVYGQCKSWLDNGLQARAITRDLEWGISVPVKGAEGKVLYVWFDAPIGYISDSIEWAQKTGNDWEPYWKDEDTRLIHFIGKDNIVFHCIIFPVILKLYGDYILPDNVPANEFLNLEGDKISTSRNWAVWLHEYLQEFPGKQDLLRYTLTANAPETKDNDFTWKDFQAKNNNELVAIFGNFINRAVVLTHKFFDGKLPNPNDIEPIDQQLINDLKEQVKKIEEALDIFKFREALFQMMEVARKGNKYLADNEPWKKIKQDPERVKTIMNLSLQLAANLSIICQPFLPFTSEKIKRMLNHENMCWGDAGTIDLLPVGHSINKAELLFEKVEDNQIEEQVEKLNKAKALNLADQYEEKEYQPIKPTINYDDFQKLDIRVGEVLTAEKVKKSNKLLKLLIDTGVDKRTILSGIAKHFEPGELIGQQVTVLVNLQPRKMMGVESNGMVLMAENEDGSLKLLKPHDLVKNGSVVS